MRSGRFRPFDLLPKKASSKTMNSTAQPSAQTILSTASSSSSDGVTQWFELNSDKSKMQLVQTSGIEWSSTSQAGGVYRKMIERQGTEKVARATTIVRFDPNQSFPRHVHDGGEEFLVLDGVWRDDYGAFPKYSYIRNYIGSGHTPSIGEEGCTILVKLRQMSHLSKDEPEHKSWGVLTPDVVRAEGEVLAMDQSMPENVTKEALGVRSVPLFSSHLERTFAQVWPPNAKLNIAVPKHGMEIFVVDGWFSSNLGEHNEWSWCRVPNEKDNIKNFEVQTKHDGAYVWIKEGHLASDEVGV